MSLVRVRFAPSPTGALHLGGARTALLNWLTARSMDGKIILRIDDTDLSRSEETHLTKILEGFDWLGLTFDEGPVQGGPFGPYRQSKRLDIYHKYLEQLLEQELAYPCYCSQEKLQAEREAQQKTGKTPRYAGTCRHLTQAEREAKEAQAIQPVYRFRSELSVLNEELTVHDLIRGEVTFAPEQVDDFVIFKSDGWPTYHFASVVDDIEMAITHIIRAEEHLSNAPRHLLLFRAFGTRAPIFAHVPMILAPDRSKLSKRHGAVSVDEFRSLGFLPEALMNYCLLLGWSPKDGQEILTVEEAVQQFRLEDVSNHPAIYDMQKLRWLNGHYLRTLPLERIWEEALPFFQSAGYLSDSPAGAEKELALSRIAAVRERVNTLQELSDALDYFYRPIIAYEEKGVKKYFSRPGVADLLLEAHDQLREIEPWTAERIEHMYRQIIGEKGFKGGELIHPTRLALTGRTVGPGLFDIMALLGREKTLERLAQAAAWIDRMDSV